MQVTRSAFSATAAGAAARGMSDQGSDERLAATVMLRPLGSSLPLGSPDSRWRAWC
jgi:hypothetical protein